MSSRLQELAKGLMLMGALLIAGYCGYKAGNGEGFIAGKASIEQDIEYCKKAYDAGYVDGITDVFKALDKVGTLYEREQEPKSGESL